LLLSFLYIERIVQQFVLSINMKGGKRQHGDKTRRFLDKKKKYIAGAAG
jgi:hypothetical protein